MRARWLLSLAILALPLVQGGCATPAVLEKISPTKKVTDTVEDVTHAYRSPSDDVIVCVTGWPGGIDKESPIQEFSIVFPAGAFTDKKRQAPELEQAGWQLGLPTFNVTTQSIRSPCPAPDRSDAKSLAPVPVETIRETEFGFAYFKGNLQGAPKRYFDDRPTVPTVYRFLSSSGCADGDKLHIVYVHDKAIFDGERVVHFSTHTRKIEGRKNYLYAALLPVTVVLDAVAFVVAMPMFLILLGMGDAGSP